MSGHIGNGMSSQPHMKSSHVGRIKTSSVCVCVFAAAAAAAALLPTPALPRRPKRRRQYPPVMGASSCAPHSPLSFPANTAC
jgi:hypothetical protein